MLRAAAYITNRIGDNRESYGSPVRKGAGGSCFASNAQLMVLPLLKSATTPTRCFGNRKCSRMFATCSWDTQLKAPSISLTRTVGQVAGFLGDCLSLSQPCAGVRLVISTPFDDLLARDP